MTEIIAMSQIPALFLTAVIVGPAAMTFILILALKPLLQRYALARPNARSSHSQPTPQGAGIAIVAVTIMSIVLLSAAFLEIDVKNLISLLEATIVLALLGAIDDIRALEAIPRLAIQLVAVLIVIVALPRQFQILSAIPFWLERCLLFIVLLWFINLVNFMDGIDWMTVVEVVPLTAALAIFGLLGALPLDATIVSVVLCGAIIGFAPFNRPVARLFLGDVGSLPIGMLLGWLLILLAGRGHIVAALLLPLYYVADATITLLRRLINGEKVLHAHRHHFYQRASDGGFSIYQIIGRVFGLNMVLVSIAALTLVNPSIAFQLTGLAIGSALVATLLWNFNSAHRSN